MSWPIPVVPDVVRVPRRRLLARWLFGLPVLYAAAAPLILWFWNRQNGMLRAALALAPLVLYLLLAVSVWIHRKYQADAWEAEKNNIRKKWQQWAGRNVAVLSAGISLPDEINLHDVMNNRGAFMGTEAFALGRLRQNQAEEECLEYIAALSEHNCIDKVYFYIAKTDMTKSAPQQEEPDFSRLKDAAERDGRLNRIEIVFQDKWFDFDQLESWAEEIDGGLHVVFSSAVNAEESPLFTENRIWLAFAASDWAKQGDFQIKGFVRRPMDVDIENKEAALASLGRFDEFGLAGRKAAAFWPLLPQKEGAGLNRLLAEAGLYPQGSEDKTLVHYPECYIGVRPPNMDYLAFAMAVCNLGEQPDQLFSWKKEGDTVGLGLLYAEENDGIMRTENG